MTAAPPLVGPGESDRATRAFFERRADLHRSERRLSIFSFPNAVGPRLGDEQRLVTGNVLKAGQIRAQLVLAMQVDVEGADVEERQVQELGGREVHVGK